MICFTKETLGQITNDDLYRLVSTVLLLWKPSNDTSVLKF